MPIIGLTDEGGRWPRLGVLRKGAPKPNEKQPGRDLDEQFRFVGVDSDVSDAWEAAFGSVLVESVEVRLPYATVDENWSAWREEWVAGGLKRRCNAREVVLRYSEKMDGGRGGFVSVPSPCDAPACKCSAVGRLEVMVPGLERMGTVTVLTTSLHDIQNIDGALRALALELGTRFGTVDLSRIPMVLRRVPREISTPTGKNGKRARRTKYLLALEVSPGWIRSMLAASASTPEALADGSWRALPAPDGYDDDGEAYTIDASTGELLGAVTLPDGEPDSWSETIAGAVDLDELRSFWSAIVALEPVPRRRNVEALYWARVVALVVAGTEDGSVSVPAAVDILRNVPDGTDGLEAARFEFGVAAPAGGAA